MAKRFAVVLLAVGLLFAACKGPNLAHINQALTATPKPAVGILVLNQGVTLKRSGGSTAPGNAVLPDSYLTLPDEVATILRESFGLTEINIYKDSRPAVNTMKEAVVIEIAMVGLWKEKYSEQKDSKTGRIVKREYAYRFYVDVDLNFLKVGAVVKGSTETEETPLPSIRLANISTVMSHTESSQTGLEKLTGTGFPQRRFEKVKEVTIEKTKKLATEILEAKAE